MIFGVWAFERKEGGRHEVIPSEYLDTLTRTVSTSACID
jgi:hypothetical protein